MRCVARCARSSANVAAHIASHRTPQALGEGTGRSMVHAVKRCPAWHRCGGWRRGTQLPMPQNLMRHAAAALAFGAWCPAPGWAEAGSCRRPGSQGSGPCGWGRWLGRSGWAMPPVLSRAARQGRRRAYSTGAGLRIAPWRVAGVCRPPAVEAGEAAQRSNAAVWPQPQSPSPCCGSGHQGGAADLVFHLGGAVAQGAGVDVAR